MKNYLFINVLFLCIVFGCKTTKNTIKGSKNGDINNKTTLVAIDYCTILDSIRKTNYFQNTYHNDVRPKTKIIMENRGITIIEKANDSIAKYWKAQGYRVVRMNLQPNPYRYDSSGYVSEKSSVLADNIFQDRFKDSLKSVLGTIPPKDELTKLIHKRKEKIRCNN